MFSLTPWLQSVDMSHRVIVLQEMTFNTLWGIILRTDGQYWSERNKQHCLISLLDVQTSLAFHPAIHPHGEKTNGAVQYRSRLENVSVYAHACLWGASFKLRINLQLKRSAIKWWWSSILAELFEASDLQPGLENYWPYWSLPAL